MNWIILTAGAVVLWGLVNIMDKHIISDELKDPKIVTVVYCFTVYLVFIAFALVRGKIMVDASIILWAMLAGILYSLAQYCYYYVMKKEEVSRFVPVLASEPMFVALGSFLIFAERLHWLDYVGMLLIFGGAVLISHEKKIRKVKYKHLFIYTFLVLFFWAGRNLIFSHTTNQVDVGPIYFWFGIGGILVPLIIVLLHHPHLKKKAQDGVKHFVFNALISGVALLLYIKAISVGSVSLVTALLATKPLLVFLAAIFLSYYSPKFLREKYSAKVVLKRSIAIILIMIGGIIIVT